MPMHLIHAGADPNTMIRKSFKFRGAEQPTASATAPIPPIFAAAVCDWLDHVASAGHSAVLHDTAATATLIKTLRTENKGRTVSQRSPASLSRPQSAIPVLCIRSVSETPRARPVRLLFAAPRFHAQKGG